MTVWFCINLVYLIEPRSFTGIVSKPLERYIERQMTAQKLVEDIEDGINRIGDATLRQVLVMKYCKGYDSDIYVYMTLGISEKEFYRLWEQAILYFAEAYCYGALLVFEGGCKVDDILLDLSELGK